MDEAQDGDISLGYTSKVDVEVTVDLHRVSVWEQSRASVGKGTSEGRREASRVALLREEVRRLGKDDLSSPGAECAVQ